MAHDVFISYSTKDKPTADAVCATLERRGIRSWIAPRDILPGIDWGEAIIDAIEQSRVMILVFSRNANASPQIKREVERAVSKGLTVVPLRIEDVPMSKSLEYFVSTPHWLDALNPPLERHLNQLADTLRVLLDRSRTGQMGDSSCSRMPPARPPPMPVPPPPMPVVKPAAAVRAPEMPSAVGDGSPAESPNAEREAEAEAEASPEVHPEVKVKVVSDAPAEPPTDPATSKSQPAAEAAGLTTDDSSAAAKRTEFDSRHTTEPESTPSTASARLTSAAPASSTRPPAVPHAPPKPPPPVPGRPPGAPGFRPSLGAGPGAGPFPFLIKVFGPISPGAQIAIVVGGILLVLMVLSCFLLGFIGALSSGGHGY